MVKTAKKKVKKRAKAKQGRSLSEGESLYTPEIGTRARDIILTFQAIKSDGTLHYGNIAKTLGVPAKTFSNWRQEGGKYYKPDLVKVLAEALEDLNEAIDLKKTKQAMIARSQPYIRIKKTKELKIRGPKMPAMGSMDKKALLLVAKELGIKVNKTLTNGVLKLKIAEEVEKKTREVLVIVKQEEEQMHGCVAAGKLVTANIGPKNKRWTEKTELEISGLSLTDIAAKMMGKKKNG